MPQFVRIHVCLCNWITHFVIYLFLLISAVFTSVTVQCLSCVAVTIIFLWNKAKRLEKKTYYFAFISTSLKARGAVLCSPKEEERRWAGFNQQSSSMIGPFDSGCCMSLPVYCFFLHLYSTYLCEAFKGKEILLSYFFFLLSLILSQIWLLMAKRRAEETVLLDSPSKRRYFPPIYSVDMQLESMASVGGLSSPSLLAILGSPCRKRPLYFDNEEGYSGPAISPPDSGKHAKDVLKTPSSGSFPDGRRSCALSRNKRPREDSVGSDTVNATDKVGQHGLI